MLKTFIRTAAACLGGAMALALAPLPPAAHSQDAPGQTCETLVTEALQTVGSACAEVGINEACYGHTSVLATLRDGSAAEMFTASGDTLSVERLDALVTEAADPASGSWGVAILTAQADLPQESDEPLMLVLFGDTMVQDTFAVERAGQTFCQANNDSGRNLNIRQGPGTNTPVVDVLPAGETATVLGQNRDGDWLQIRRDQGGGWVYAPLVSRECPADGTPPVVADDAMLPFAPMQAIQVQTSAGGLACDNAPNGLLIKSPTGQRARIMVNGVELEMASMVFIQGGPGDSLMFMGMTGEVMVKSHGEMEKVVPGMMAEVPMDGMQAMGPPAIPYEMPLAAHPMPDVAVDLMKMMDVDMGPMCRLEVQRPANLRAGPSTEFRVVGGLFTGDMAGVYGQATDAAGFTWWQLMDGRWLREDLAATVGICDDVPVISADHDPATP